MNKLISFIKREPVLFAALLLAVVSVAIIKPAPSLCLQAIDFRTLAILFSLMIVIKAFQSQNFLNVIAARFLRLCKSQRSLYFLMTLLVFFSSMFVTNDVALLTFVPLTLLIFTQIGSPCLKLVVLETLAANLGSCFTPMGNPQNLYLFSYYAFSAGDFFLLTARIALPSLLILCGMILVLTRKSAPIDQNLLQNRQSYITFDFRTILYIADFILCLLTVFHFVNYLIMLGVTLVIMLVCNFRLFKKVDYSLLLTFVGFFIFTKTLSTVPAFCNFINSMLSSPLKTYITGILTSQVISNVPAALLLSGFTDMGKMLVLGVNVGGLGTLIASMASVISFKLYNNSEEAKAPGHKNFFGVFTIYNLALLGILGLLVFLFAAL